MPNPPFSSATAWAASLPPKRLPATSGSVAALVYATAFVPRDGQSLLDLTRLPEGAEDQVQANIVIEPPVATMPAAASRSALYGSCSETDAAWAISRQRPQPLGPFAAPVSIQAERWTASIATSSFARRIGRSPPRCSVG